MRVIAPHVVGRQQLPLREHRTNLAVDSIDVGRLELPRDDEPESGVGNGVVLELEQDHQRQMPRVGVGPLLDRLQARDEREARTAIVDVLYVQHLEPGRRQHAGRIVHGIGWEPERVDDARTGRGRRTDRRRDR